MCVIDNSVLAADVRSNALMCMFMNVVREHSAQATPNLICSLFLCRVSYLWSLARLKLKKRVK